MYPSHLTCRPTPAAPPAPRCTSTTHPLKCSALHCHPRPTILPASLCQLFSSENQVLGDILFCLAIAFVFKIVYCVMLIKKSKAASKVIRPGVGGMGSRKQTPTAEIAG